MADSVPKAGNRADYTKLVTCVAEAVSNEEPNPTRDAVVRRGLKSSVEAENVPQGDFPTPIPREHLMDDPDVTEMIVSGADKIPGRLTVVGVTHENDGTNQVFLNVNFSIPNGPGGEADEYLKFNGRREVGKGQLVIGTNAPTRRQTYGKIMSIRPDEVLTPGASEDVKQMEGEVVACMASPKIPVMPTKPPFQKFKP
jgi:hypothetical protein